MKNIKLDENSLLVDFVSAVVILLAVFGIFFGVVISSETKEEITVKAVEKVADTNAGNGMKVIGINKIFSGNTLEGITFFNAGSNVKDFDYEVTFEYEGKDYTTTLENEVAVGEVVRISKSQFNQATKKGSKSIVGV